MNIKERVYRYKNYKVVQHAKYNPKGQGMVRIQLLPSKNSYINKSDIIILNSKYIVPIAPAWSILLSIFMKHINECYGQVIDDDRLKLYIEKTVEEVSKIYITVPKKMLNADLNTILEVLNEIAKGKDITKNIGQHTLVEYAKYLQGPIKVYLMLNAGNFKENKHCNNRCLHYLETPNENEKIEELSTSDWKKIIKKCEKACIPYIIFTGDKPTNRKDLIELIEEARWFVTTLNCTGKKLTGKFCRELKDAGLDNVIIPLYSSVKEIHNKLAGEDNFDLVMTGIRNAVQFNLNVTVQIALCRSNENIIEIIKELEKIGIRNFNLSVMDSNNDNISNFEKDELTKKDILEILKKATKYADEKSLQINFKTPNFIENNLLEEINIDPPICGACAYEIAVMPNGDVVPCVNAYSSKLKLGNMMTDKWKNIWNNVKANKIKKLVLSDVTRCPLKRYFQK